MKLAKIIFVLSAFLALSLYSAEGEANSGENSTSWSIYDYFVWIKRSLIDNDTSYNPDKGEREWRLKKKLANSNIDLEDENKELKSNKKKLIDEKENLINEISNLNNAREEKVGSLRKLEEDLSEKKADLRNKNNDLGTLAEKIEKLNNSKTEIDKEIVAATKAWDDAKKSTSKIEEENKKAEEAEVQRHATRMGRMEKFFKEPKEKGGPTCVDQLAFFPFMLCDPLPVQGWLSSISVGSFYNTVVDNYFRDHRKAIDINASGRAVLWGEFESNYFGNKYNNKLTYSKELGFSLGADYSILSHNRLTFGLGFVTRKCLSLRGLWKTTRNKQVDCGGDLKFDASGKLYFLGPYLSGSFGRGYFGTMFYWGATDFPKVKSYGMIKNTRRILISDRKGHNFSFRSELGYSFHVRGFKKNPFFIKPYFTFNYYNDVQKKYHSRLQGDKIFKVNKRENSFFSTKLGLDLKYEFHHLGEGYLIPNIGIGWQAMGPLSHEDSEVEFYSPPANEDCSPKKIKGSLVTFVNEKYCSASLLLLNGGFNYIARNGIATALKLEASVGSKYQIYGAQLRLEIGW
jgi:hypothetical protein